MVGALHPPHQHQMSVAVLADEVIADIVSAAAEFDMSVGEWPVLERRQATNKLAKPSDGPSKLVRAPQFLR